MKDSLHKTETEIFQHLAAARAVRRESGSRDLKLPRAAEFITKAADAFSRLRDEVVVRLDALEAAIRSEESAVQAAGAEPK